MRTAMLAQDEQAKLVASAQIEEWMKGELSSTIRHYIRKYGATFDRKLGLAKEDLENEIRMEIWKGILSYNKSKAKLKTYLNRLIHNRFLTLYARSELGKNNMVDYFADVFATERVCESDKVTYENAESILEQRESVMEGLMGLQSELEFAIVRDLIVGETLTSMEQKHKVPRAVVIAAITKIEKLIQGDTHG
jgi:DNA-directed RNA polymerase specialized sigma24 family protein